MGKSDLDWLKMEILAVVHDAGGRLSVEELHKRLQDNGLAVDKSDVLTACESLQNDPPPSYDDDDDGDGDYGLAT